MVGHELVQLDSRVRLATCHDSSPPQQLTSSQDLSGRPLKPCVHTVSISFFFMTISSTCWATHLLLVLLTQLQQKMEPAWEPLAIGRAAHHEVERTVGGGHQRQRLILECLRQQCSKCSTWPRGTTVAVLVPFVENVFSSACFRRCCRCTARISSKT